MINLLVIIYGLLIGSFLNVCIYRIPRNESISFPPSHCTNCGNRIKWYDLIPVISYLFLKGKCRYCGEKISIRYPIIEFTTGVIFLALNIEYGLSFNFFKYALLTCFLIVIGIIDFDTTDVYLKTTASGIITGIVFIVIEHFMHYNILTFIYGGLLGGGVITAIILLTGGMGWGDLEICAMIGLFLGFKLTIVMLFFSFIFGGFAGIVLILLKLKSRKDYIPFGPYISTSCIFTIFLGERILQWYMSTLT
jgi:leader peptidase (prepilin peptidase) / N-methyltransferase